MIGQPLQRVTACESISFNEMTFQWLLKVPAECATVPDSRVCAGVAEGIVRTGGQILVDQLLINGVDRAFCVPGESYLGVLDALHEAAARLTLVTTRNEIGAVNMAEAHAKLTGKPGICFVTRGPGASHAMVGVHTAKQDSSPLILFVGLIARNCTEREALQEIDLKAMFGHTAKWVAEINDPRRIPEFVSRAFHTVQAGRPGPVVLGLPEDMCVESCEVADAGPASLVQPAPTAAAIDKLASLLSAAQRPLVILGGGGWTARAVDDMRAFIDANRLPVAVSFRCKDLFDNRHRCYIGDCSLGLDPALAQRITTSDLLLVVGTRLGEASTAGYTLVVPPTPVQPLVHVHADAEELGRVYQGRLLINAGMEEFATAAREHVRLDFSRWSDWTEAARRDYEATLRVDPLPGKLDLGRAVRWLSETLPRDTIVVSDGGNFATFLNRYYECSGFRTFLGPTNGAMGYCVPAAVAAKLAQPQRLVVGFAGDGGFMMTSQELATAVQYETPVVYLVFNNGLYGTIRMYQEKEYPGRYPGTILRNPDFAAYARAFGAHGETVEDFEQFKSAFERARASGKPAVLDLKWDPEGITTRATLTSLRTAALAQRARE